MSQCPIFRRLSCGPWQPPNWKSLTIHTFNVLVRIVYSVKLTQMEKGFVLKTFRLRGSFVQSILLLMCQDYVFMVVLGLIMLNLHLRDLKLNLIKKVFDTTRTNVGMNIWLFVHFTFHFSLFTFPCIPPHTHIHDVVRT